MKDIWDHFLGQTLTGVVYVVPPRPRGLASQLFLVFRDAEGYESHVEIYTNWVDAKWSNARGGGIDTLGHEEGDEDVVVWKRGG